MEGQPWDILELTSYAATPVGMLVIVIIGSGGLFRGPLGF